MDTIDRGYPYGSTAGGTHDVHHGVEFYNGSGTPVLASASGTVIYSGDDKTHRFSPWASLYGNLILLKHTVDGMPFKAIYTLYGHLSRIDVLTGQIVTSGQKIGEVGATGGAIGSHLHFEVRLDPQDYNSTLNPEMWIAPHPGNGTLAIHVEEQNGEPAYPTFTIQYFVDRNQLPSASFEVNPYASETINRLDPWKETACLGDQPAGWYRITFYWNGLFNENWVEMVPGKLLLANFIVKE
jgi:hypothetical protein